MKFGQRFCESCILWAEILSTKWEKIIYIKISLEIFSTPSCLFTGTGRELELVNHLDDDSAWSAGLWGWLHKINAEFAFCFSCYWHRLSVFLQLDSPFVLKFAFKNVI